MWLATPSLYPSGIHLCYYKDGGDDDVDDPCGWRHHRCILLGFSYVIIKMVVMVTVMMMVMMMMMTHMAGDTIIVSFWDSVMLL